jgi:hypothetical protein
VCPIGAPLSGGILGTAVFSGHAMVFAWLVYFMANPNASLANQEPVPGVCHWQNPQKKERPARTNSHRPSAMIDVN